MPVREELSLLILLLTSGMLIRVQAQQGVVLTSSGELCFGQTFTLTCTHPDPFQDPAKYLPVAIGFIENGGILHFAEREIAQRFTLTRLNSTASTLSFTVTEEYYASRAINYSCFLTPTGSVVGREESNQIAIDANVQAQQGIVLTSSGELCFGQTVTLTCTHPDPLQDLDKYQPVLIGFIENGEVLDFLGDLATAQRFALTRLNSTASNVSFAVTEEDHANGVVTCSCFLTLDGGGRKESNAITMDVDARPPTIMSKPDNTSGLLQWSPSPSCPHYLYIYNLTWVRVEDNSTDTVSTEEATYDFTGMPGGEYTVALKARVANFSNLSESQPVHVQFNLTVSSQNVEENIAAVSAVASVFLIISTVMLAVILVGVFVRMRRRKRREEQEDMLRNIAFAGAESVALTTHHSSRETPVPMETNPSYAKVQYSTEKEIPCCGNLAQIQRSTEKKTPLYENL